MPRKHPLKEAQRFSWQLPKSFEREINGNPKLTIRQKIAQVSGKKRRGKFTVNVKRIWQLNEQFPLLHVATCHYRQALNSVAPAMKMRNPHSLVESHHGSDERFKVPQI